MWKYLSLNKLNGTKTINMYNEISDQIEIITVYFYQNGEVKLINQNNEIVNPKKCYPIDDMKNFLELMRPDNIFGNRVKNAIISFNRNNQIDKLISSI